MKKTLVAIAALAAFGAQAQSTVTLSGNLDFAGAQVSGTQALAKGNTFSTTVGTASTSVINIRAVEDLGGGMKVTAHFGIDPRLLANDSLSTTNNISATSAAGAATAPTAANPPIGTAAAQATTVTGFARDELFVGIEGRLGNLRLGAPNSIGLNSFQVASPLGTGIGSGYTGGGTATTMTNSYMNTRYSRSARWDSPVMGGFQASVLYAPGNDQAAFVSASSATAVSTIPTALLILDARKATEIGLRYDNGPLAVSFANVTMAAQTNATGWYSSTTLANTVKTSNNMLNANYNMGATTLYAGFNDGESVASTTTVTKTKGARAAIKHTMGAIDLMASYTTQNTTASGATTDVKAKVTGFRADYNLSKTAAVYAGYEKYDTGATYANSLTTGDRTITSVGLKKQF